MGPIYRSRSIQGKDTHRHMLELAILGLLKERSMHGYQLSRELGDSLGGFWRVSYGSLYPTLRRLEKEGDVVAEVDPASRGRRKTTYRITPEGERLFLELLQETPTTTRRRTPGSGFGWPS